MPEPELSIVLGALARNARPRPSPTQDALAARWRSLPLAPLPPAETPGVISLMEGWIRLLERRAGVEQPLPGR